MEIQVTPKSLRAMAKRIRAAAAPLVVPHSKSLEILAQTLGYRNYDELSGILKKQLEDERALKAPCIPEFQPFEVMVSAYACDTWGVGPSWARFTCDKAFLTQILELQEMVKRKKLSVASCDDSPEWDNQETLRIRNDELKVSDTEFWFHANPKHASYSVETCPIDISLLVQAALGTLPRHLDCMGFADNILFCARDESAESFARGLFENEEIDIDEVCIDQMS